MFRKSSIMMIAFAAMTLVSTVQVNAEGEFQITAKILNQDGKPTLQILNTQQSLINETEANGFKIVGAPLVIMVNNKGEMVKVLDTQSLMLLNEQENAESKNIIAKLLSESTWTTENGKQLMDGGALKVLSGLGLLGAGSVVVALVLTTKTGKFLTLQTCKGTSWAFRTLWTKICNLYERQKFNWQLGHLGK